MIGLIPCAGRAERLHGLPKYLLPLPDGYLLKNLTNEMSQHCYCHTITNQENAELLKHFPFFEGRVIVIDKTQTMVGTLLSAYQSREMNSRVLMAMPDTYWTSEPDLFPQMAQLLDVSDVVLACWQFRDSQRGKLGAVDLDGTTVREIVDKDPFSPHQFFWGAMAWRPSFWQYMKPEHPHLGIAVNAAIADGLHVRAVIAEGEYYDCGTFEGYAELCRDLTEEKAK